MNPTARRWMILALVGTFVLQTWLVYSDPAGRAVAPLSTLAARGRALWHTHNCQSCHQLYGFGGFLGPDLTNRVEEIPPARLEVVMTDGVGQMPAFELDAEERGAIVQFLIEVNRSGTSQPRLREGVGPRELLAELVTRAEERSAPLPADAARGFEIVLAENCLACHLPNPESLHRSKDLTLAARESGREHVLKVLAEGVPGTAMVRLALSEEDRAAVFTFLEWLDGHGEDVRRAFGGLAADGSFNWKKVPWFEFD